MSKEIVEAVHVLEREKGISSERLMEALEDALLSAYKKTPDAARYARVDMDRNTGDFKVFELLIPPELEDKLLAEVEPEEPTVDPETGELREPEEPELDPEKLAEYSDQIDERDVTPGDFGRSAAQTAKQVILQRIREAERDMMFEEYQDRVGELITGIVQQSDSRYTLVQLRERVEALLPKSEQVVNERYDHGQRIKAVITDVSNQAKGPSIIVSRRSPELIRKLFELEVPEIADGLVEVQNVAREPGYRSETEFAPEEADMAYEDDEASGRCAAIMSTGKRCPNAALPGSRYCGLPAHQALEGKDTDEVEAPSPSPPPRSRRRQTRLRRRE